MDKGQDMEEKKKWVSSLYMDRLRCNGMINPLGISGECLLFQWIIAGRGENILQYCCRLQVSERKDFTDLIYENVLYSGDTQWEIRLGLEEKTKYYWRVQACVDENLWLDWSVPASFETGMKGEESWKADWIEAEDTFYQDGGEMNMSPCLYKEWVLDGGWESGRIYITAHGFYELRINGKKVGSYALAPDFTAYDKSIYYQTFDLGDCLLEGKNSLEILLADGWYAGHAQGIPGLNHLYGERPALILQAEIRYPDGQICELLSDDTFTAYTTPIRYADLFMGEVYDTGRVRKQYGTVLREYPKNVLMPQEYEGIEEKTILEAISLSEIEKGTYIVDFGQVTAGRERLYLKGEKGSRIKVEHSEMLDPETGDLLEITQNFPNHAQTDYVYINEDNFVYEPQFSFQGYRYLKISGIQNRLTRKQCRTVVLESALQDTCSFSCSNDTINRLVENVRWSQWSNMISIPTDCPQRERGGFTGDAQIFCRTAAWQQNVQGFFRRWLKQCRLEQLRRGQIPIVVPYTDAYKKSEPNPGWTSAGWGDAIIFVPEDLFKAYGNKQILEENYDAMEKWMAYVTACAEDFMPEEYYMDYEKRPFMRYLWNAGYHWGDWLMPGFSDEEGVAVSKEVTAALFYFREAKAMQEISGILQRDDREIYYNDLSEHIKKAFHEVYITEDNRLKTELQGLYVMAIAFGIVQGEEKKNFEMRLNQLVEKADFHLATGFLSTPFLLDVLWNAGYYETAYRVLYQDTCPSWLYEVKMGATTIWENWEGIREDGTISSCSFNHYAYGCVADFIYRKIAGVKKMLPGYRKVLIYPEASKGLSFVSFSYDTMFGKLQVKWEKAENGFCYQLVIPHGMTAEVRGEKERRETGSGEWSFTLL